MSKKMMKRSLALGALMAFVITGSAMAMEYKDGTYSNAAIAAGQYVIPTQSGDIDIVGCTFENNVKDTPSGVEIGVVLYASSGDVDVTNSDFIGNKNIGTGRKQGIIRLATTTGDFTSCKFIGNVTNDMGSALYLSGANNGVFKITDCTFDNNSAGEGGAVVINGENSATVTFKNTDFTNNVGSSGGGALNVQGSAVAKFEGVNNFISNTAVEGGAIKNFYNGAKLIFTEGSTTNFENNESTSGKGGAIYNAPHSAATDDAVIEIYGNVNFSGNTADGKANDIYNERELKILGGTTTSEGGIISEGDKAAVTLSDATIVLAGDNNVTSLNVLNGENGIIRFENANVDLAIEKNNSEKLGFEASGEVNDAVGGDASKLLENVALNGDTTMTMEEGNLQGEKVITFDIDKEVVSETQKVNTKSDAVSNAGMALKGHWRAHMNDMNKRMGELRNSNGEHGVWTRMVRGESEYQGAKMQYNQYQLGYDEKLSVDKRWTVGAAVTFSEGDASYGSGSTDDKSTAFAIYGSKLNNDGTFVDLIARYAHLESDLDDRNYGTGDYSTNGMSVSAEFGKRIQQGNGLWIEPQVELTYGSVDSADVAFDGGAYKAHYDSMDSFIARVGFALGKDIKQGNVYARASYLYDFDGETETQFVGGAPIKEDFGGGWWEVGVGANINLSKATYIYADIEKTFGGEVDTNWQWNLGVRYSF